MFTKKVTCLLLSVVVSFGMVAMAFQWSNASVSRADGTAPIPHPPIVGPATFIADGTAPIPHPPTVGPATFTADGTAPIPHPPTVGPATFIADGTAPIPHPPVVA
jgi:hypothetical protein